MNNSKKKKGKRKEQPQQNETPKSSRKIPLLSSVKGDYFTPENIRIKYDLDRTLQVEARSWTNIERLVDFYFSNVVTWNQSEEDIEHTLDDTIRILKSESDTLKCFISNFKCASFATLKKFHLYFCQLIQKRITLILYTILNDATWRVGERRSAEIPIVFDKIKEYIKIWELFGFLFVSEIRILSWT